MFKPLNLLLILLTISVVFLGLITKQQQLAIESLVRDHVVSLEFQSQISGDLQKLRRSLP